MNIEDNKTLVEMQQIPREHTEWDYSDYESCDMCHHTAFFKYKYNGDILYRCQGHKILDINKLNSKWGY